MYDCLDLLREIKRIMREVEESRITAEEGWRRVDLIYLKSVDWALKDESEPLV